MLGMARYTAIVLPQADMQRLRVVAEALAIGRWI